MGKNGRTGKRIPVWVKILIGFIILFIAGSIAISIYLSSLINNRLRQVVWQASNGLYALDFKKVSVNALTGNLSLRDVELKPDTAAFAKLKQLNVAPHMLVGGRAEKLQLKNVRWLSYLVSNNLRIGKILIAEPQFDITKFQQQNDSAQKSPGLYELLSKQVKDLHIGLFSIGNAVINYQVADTAAGARRINRIEHLNIGFTKIRFDRNAASPQLVADDYNIRLNEYRHRTTDSLYWIGMSGLDYNSKKKRLKLASFYVEPRFPDKEFSKQLKEQETRYDMKLENIVANGFDMSLLAENGKIIIPQAEIHKGDIDIFMDRGLPAPGVDHKNVAISQKILNLDAQLAIQSIKLGKIRLSYREYHPVADSIVTIPFEHVSGEVTNVTTIPGYIRRNALMKASLSAQLLNTAVNARFEFDLSRTDGTFASWLKLDELEADKLNPIMVPVAKMEFRKGVLRQLEATVNGNANLASANVNLLYDGLKVNLLKMEGDSLKKKGLPTMFANLFIFDDNPKDGVTRRAMGIVKKRGFGRSFFNMLWGSISMGIQQIIAKKQGLKF